MCPSIPCSGLVLEAGEALDFRICGAGVVCGVDAAVMLETA